MLMSVTQAAAKLGVSRRMVYDLAAQIYAALLKTTPLKTVRRAMLNVSEKVKNADAVHR